MSTRTELDTKKMKSICAAYKAHCTQDFKRAKKLINSETPDQAELEALRHTKRYRNNTDRYKNCKIMSLEIEEEIQTDMESALSFQDNIS